MKNQLHAQGDLFGLNLKSITKDHFTEIKKLGRKSKSYEDLKEASNNENAVYGFYQYEGKPTFEMYLNEASLGLKKGYKTGYEIRYLPVQGSSIKVTGAEEYFYVIEKGFKNGNSYVDFHNEYQPSELIFEVHRIGMFNRSICSLIQPKYMNLEFNVVWNWSSFSSDYIISTRGKMYKLD